MLLTMATVVVSNVGDVEDDRWIFGTRTLELYIINPEWIRWGALTSRCQIHTD